MFYAKIVGATSLKRNFEELDSKDLKNKVMRSVAGAGGPILNKAVKREAKKIRYSGQLFRSIGTVARQYTAGKSTTFATVVGSRSGFRVPRKSLKFKKKIWGPGKGGKLGPRVKKGSGYVDPMKYFRFVERGTKIAQANDLFARSALANERSIRDAMGKRFDEKTQEATKIMAERQKQAYQREMAQMARLQTSVGFA